MQWSLWNTKGTNSWWSWLVSRLDNTFPLLQKAPEYQRSKSSASWRCFLWWGYCSWYKPVSWASVSCSQKRLEQRSCTYNRSEIECWEESWDYFICYGGWECYTFIRWNLRKHKQHYSLHRLPIQFQLLENLIGWFSLERKQSCPSLPSFVLRSRPNFDIHWASMDNTAIHPYATTISMGLPTDLLFELKSTSAYSGGYA